MTVECQLSITADVGGAMWRGVIHLESTRRARVSAVIDAAEMTVNLLEMRPEGAGRTHIRNSTTRAQVDRGAVQGARPERDALSGTFSYRPVALVPIAARTLLTHILRTPHPAAPHSFRRLAMNTSPSANDVISSDRVEGTDVYNDFGDKLGSIDDLMIDKRSGQVRYAVLEFGGFLGMGTDRYPLPWDMLKYDTTRDGYVVPLDKDRLEGAPRYAEDKRPDYDDNYGRQVNDYYGVPYL